MLSKPTVITSEIGGSDAADIESSKVLMWSPPSNANDQAVEARCCYEKSLQRGIAAADSAFIRGMASHPISEANAQKVLEIHWQLTSDRVRIAEEAIAVHRG